MKLRVSPFSARVRRQYATVVALASAIASFYLINVDIQSNQRRRYIIAASVGLFCVYLVIWILANIRRQARLNINGSSLIIKTGDLFSEQGLKVIAFNEYFDTNADDILISKTSLNGQYMLKMSSSQRRDLDSRIANDPLLAEHTIGVNTTRRRGKKVKYPLGSVFVDGDFLLVAFSHFDGNDKAVLSLKEYVACLLNFWEEVDRVYAGRSVAVPLMGAGITRFKDTEVQPQELLKILIWTFKISRIKFKYPANATIVIHTSNADKINFYDIVD